MAVMVQVLEMALLVEVMGMLVAMQPVTLTRMEQVLPDLARIIIMTVLQDLVVAVGMVVLLLLEEGRVLPVVSTLEVPWRMPVTVQILEMALLVEVMGMLVALQHVTVTTMEQVLLDLARVISMTVLQDLVAAVGMVVLLLLAARVLPVVSTLEVPWRMPVMVQVPEMTLLIDIMAAVANSVAIKAAMWVNMVEILEARSTKISGSAIMKMMPLLDGHEGILNV